MSVNISEAELERFQSAARALTTLLIELEAQGAPSVSIASLEKMPELITWLRGKMLTVDLNEKFQPVAVAPSAPVREGVYVYAPPPRQPHPGFVALYAAPPLMNLSQTVVIPHWTTPSGSYGK